MASCLTNDSAHFGLRSLESANNSVLSSVSFQRTSSLSNTSPDSLAVSNLCAQVVLASASDMQSAKKTSKMVVQSKTKRGGRRSLPNDCNDAAPVEKKLEVENASSTPTVSKIVTRRCAEMLERAASVSGATLDGANSAEVVKPKRRSRKRTAEFSDQEPDTSSSKQANSVEEPEKKRKLRSDNAEEQVPMRVPGTAYKICGNCGTVADKTKAKKCRKCKKFFFNHWAKRCRIPPCPKCHFSRKAKPQERVPLVCEKCGFQLPLCVEEDGDTSKADSSSTDLDSSVSSKTKEDEDGSGRIRRDSKSDELSLTSTVSSPLISPDNLGSFKALEDLNSSVAVIGSTPVGVDCGGGPESTGQGECIRNDGIADPHDQTQMSLDFTDLEDISQHKSIDEENQGESQSVASLQETLEKATQDVQDMLGKIEDEHVSAPTSQVAVTEEEQDMTGNRLVPEEDTSGSHEIPVSKLTGGCEIPAEVQMIATLVPQVPIREHEKHSLVLPEVSVGNQLFPEVGQGESKEAAEASKELKEVKGENHNNSVVTAKQACPVNEVVTAYSCKPVLPLSALAANCVSAGSQNPNVPPALTNVPTSTLTGEIHPINQLETLRGGASTAMPPAPLAGTNLSDSHGISSESKLASSGLPRTIDRSLEEHFERSLVGFKGEKVPAHSDSIISHCENDSLAVLEKDNHRIADIAENMKIRDNEKVEIGTIVTVDRLSPNIWSSSSDTANKHPSSVSICTMEKPPTTSVMPLTSKQLPKLSTYNFGKGILRPSMSYSNPQHTSTPSVLNPVSRPALPRSANSPLSPHLVSPHVSPLVASSSAFPFFPVPVSHGSAPHKLAAGSFSSLGSNQAAVRMTPSVDSSVVGASRLTVGPLVGTKGPSTCATQASIGSISPSLATMSPSIGTMGPSESTGIIVSTVGNVEPSVDSMVGPSAGNVGPSVDSMVGPSAGNVGPSVCSVGPSVGSRVGPSAGNVGPSVGNVGPSVGNVGSTIAALRDIPPQYTSVGLSQTTITPTQAPSILTQGNLPLQGNTSHSPSALPDEQSKTEFLTDRQPGPAPKQNLSQLLPKLESKGLSSSMGQPPSLVSIGASGTVTITRSYTLPQAPRVSIAVAPPPLQNFKDSLLTKSIPSSLQSLIPSIATIKTETSSVRSTANSNAPDVGLAGRHCGLPPPLLSASSLAELSADTGTSALEQRFTSSRPVTVNIVSAANPQSALQKGAFSLGEQQQLRSSVSMVSQASSIVDKVSFSSTPEKVSMEGTQKSSEFKLLSRNTDGMGEKGNERSEATASVLGNVRAEVLSPPPTSFQKLDNIMRSPNTANKIRVTLLKDNLNSDTTSTTRDKTPPPVSSPTPPSPLFPPSGTRLITKVYEFPRHLAGSSVCASVPPSTTSSSMQSSSFYSSTSWSSGTGSISSGVQAMPMTTPTSVATLPPVSIGRGVTAAVIRRSVSPQAAGPQSSVFKFPVQTNSLPIQTNSLPSFDRVSRDSTTNWAKGASKNPEGRDEKGVMTEDSEEGSARTNGVGLRWRQHRNISGLDPHFTKSYQIPDIYSNKTFSDEQDSSKEDNTFKKTNYRKILPNTLKQGSGVPSSACSSASLQRAVSPTHSHVRSGVVTVQVCSNIPATISLSSIITPKVTQAEATEASLGDNCSSVFSSTESCSNPESVSSARVRKRSMMSGGGGVMVTPLSPSVLPPSRTVAQIVTSSVASKDNSTLVESRKTESRIAHQTRSKIGAKKRDTNEETSQHSVLYSEEFLDSSNESGEHLQHDSRQAMEATGNGTTKRRSSKSKGEGEVSDESGEGDEEDEDEDEDGEDNDREGRSREGQDNRDSKEKKHKKDMKSKKDTILYTVKLRDCYMHHMMWEEHRVVLIVPTHQKSDCNKRSKLSGDGCSGVSSGGMDSTNASISERRRRRKPKHEVLQDTDDMDTEDDVGGGTESSLSTSSSHVRSPCFSMYELRLKHFRHMTSNAVYAYTYKHQIKSLRTPTHWVQVLRRMGGVQEHGHTFRLIDILRVKEMCQQFNVLSSWPSNLDALARNEFPKSRIMIDLSHFSPDELMETEHLEIIPACPYAKPPTPPPADTKPKRPYTKRKHLLKEVKEVKEERKKRKYTRKDSVGNANKKPKLEDAKSAEAAMEDADSNQPLDSPSVHKEHPPAPVHRATLPLPEDSGGQESGSGRSERPPQRKAVIKRWPSGVRGNRPAEYEEDRMDEGEEEDEEEEEMEMSPSTSSSRRLAPLGNRMAEMPSPTTKSKKKVCPDCYTPIARKCKKCPSCGKSFGVFTFGRKLCPMCGRTNKARMTECFQCGHPLSNAPKAVPKVYNALCDSYMDQPKPCSRTGSVFGAKKKRNLHSLPGYSSMTSSGQNHGSSKLKDQAAMFQPKMTLNSLRLQDSPSKFVDQQTEIRGKKFERSREVVKSNGDDGEDPVGNTPVVNQEQTPAPLLLAEKTEKEFERRTAKSKHSGYQYGRVAWGEADITCLVDEKGVVKVCLQELCSKVLHNHGKGNVFDVVKSLNLPLEHGDSTLLRKLQALGLHTNRSPMCRLIASEELWTLLDALEEPVPEEVYHHLDQMSTCNTPLLSPHEVAEANGESSNDVGNASAELGREATPEETEPAGDSGNKKGGERGGGTSGAGSDDAPPTSGPSHLTPASVVGTQSPRHGAGSSGTMVEEDEHGFESTLHEVECSDGQSVSILRAFNGELFGCVTEFWRKYFPEVNRNHLTSALKRLNLETILPTGQQATLLRSAGVISLRGAAGRLMKFESLEKLLDDFGIPLQIGKPTDKIYFSSKPSHPPNTTSHGQVGRPRMSMRRPTVRYNTSSNVGAHQSMATLPPDKVLVSKEDAMYATFMRNILGAINPGDLHSLLEDVRQETLSSTSGLGNESSEVESDISAIQQLIYSRRQLCNVLADEISYLTTSNHGYMAESIRLDHMEKQFLKDVQDILNTYNISLLSK